MMMTLSEDVEVEVVVVDVDDGDFDVVLLEQLLGGLDQLKGADVDLLYLGRFWLEPDELFRPGFVRPGYSHCTYAYLLTRRGLELVLTADLGTAIVPVDEFLPAMYLEHPRQDVRERFLPRLQALAFEPPLVMQLPKDVAGSDTENSASVTAQDTPTPKNSSPSPTLRPRPRPNRPPLGLTPVTS